MTYNKPEIIVLAGAVSAVKGQNKDDAVHLDSDGSGIRNVSAGAYEADE